MSNKKNPQNELNEMARAKGLRVEPVYCWIVHDKDGMEFVTRSFGEAWEFVKQYGMLHIFSKANLLI